MRRLILLRHATAAAPKGGEDHDRPLTASGREDMAFVAEWLKSHGFGPEHVLVSTARRTRETWALAERVLGDGTAADFESAIYEACPGDIMAAIHRTKHSVMTLMVVGHNPGLQDLTVQLAAAADGEARRRFSAGMPPGGVAVLDCAIDDWSELAPGTATLILFTRPQDLGAMS